MFSVYKALHGFMVHSEDFSDSPQFSTGPLSLAMPDLNIWGANLSPSLERDKAGNKPLCRAEEGFSCFLSLPLLSSLRNL